MWDRTGLSNVATKPVDVGVRLATVRPRLTMALLVPVMLLVTESVTVIVWLPGDLSTSVAKLPVPPVRVELTGKTALASVLVKCTVPV